MTSEQRAEAESIRAQIMALVERHHAVAHASEPFAAGRTPVPVSGRVYGAREMQFLVDAALDFWLTTGRFNDAFEQKLAARVGARHALTVNSGSSANLVAFSALTSHKLRRERLLPGDEVITCATGFPTTINPAILWGMTPVFVDVDLPTYNIDVSALEAALSPRSRAVMVAHTLGNPFDVAAVTAFCDKHGLYLIEDCCDALGATFNGRHVGSFGDVGTLSFYPAHHITMGEGGAVFTNNAMLAKVMESFRDWGRDCFCPPGRDDTCNNRFGWTLGDLPPGYDHKYVYSHLGFNLKITDMQAAVGLAQLERLETFIESRRRNFTFLQDAFLEFEDVFIRPVATEGSQPSWFGYPLTIRADAGLRRDDLLRQLNAHGVGTRLLFGGNLVRQPYMKDRPFRAPSPLVNADAVVERTFWIGLHPGLSQAHLEYAVDCIRNHLSASGRGSGRGADVRAESPRPTAHCAAANGERTPIKQASARALAQSLPLRFLVVGALNTAVGYSLFLVALMLTPTSFDALVVSYVLSVLFNFVSSGSLVFRDRDWRRLPPFVGVYLLIFLFQAVGLGVLEAAGAPPWLAGLALLPATVAFSYCLQRSLVFRTPA